MPPPLNTPFHSTLSRCPRRKPMKLNRKRQWRQASVTLAMEPVHGLRKTDRAGPGRQCHRKQNRLEIDDRYIRSEIRLFKNKTKENNIKKP